jgi:phosphoglycolate phosphatase
MNMNDITAFRLAAGFLKTPLLQPLALKAVSFDLDGTLVDSAGDIALAANAVLVDFGRPVMPEGVIRNLIGKGVPAWMPRLLAMAFGAPQPHRVPEALARFDHHYASLLAQQTVVYAGVHEALTYLREAGLQLACVTNKDACFTGPMLERMGLAGYFDLMLSGDMLPRKKPDPLPLLHAAGHFGIAPQQMLMVGDSENDALAARRAGSPIFCVSYGYTEGKQVSAFEADLVIDDLRDMLPYLRKV